MALIADLHDRVGRPARRGDLYNTIADFPFLSVASPICRFRSAGFCLLLFIVERIFLGAPSDPPVSQLRSCAIRLTRDRQSMDILILLTTMLVCFLIGMPIAYSLALAAIAGAWSIGIPLGSGVC